MDLGFADATAVIAGGSRGIGLATALCLAEQGARVGVVGRNEAPLAEAAKSLAAAGSPDVLTLATDLTSASDVDAVFATVGERWGALNVLVNAAGPAGAGRFEDLGDTQWTAALDQGVLSAVRCVRGFAAAAGRGVGPGGELDGDVGTAPVAGLGGLYRGQERVTQRDQKSRAQSRGQRDPGQRRRAGSNPHRLGATDAGVGRDRDG